MTQWADRNFVERLNAYVEGCDRITAEHFAKHYGKAEPEKCEVQWLQKRVRIVRNGSVHSFVDIATGDVLKPAGWKAPAKHARGNIFDEHNGLGSMGPYGPQYLR